MSSSSPILGMLCSNQDWDGCGGVLVVVKGKLISEELSPFILGCLTVLESHNRSSQGEGQTSFDPRHRHKDWNIRKAITQFWSPSYERRNDVGGGDSIPCPPHHGVAEGCTKRVPAFGPKIGLLDWYHAQSRDNDLIMQNEKRDLCGRLVVTSMITFIRVTAKNKSHTNSGLT